MDEHFRLKSRLTFQCSCAGNMAVRNNMKFSLPLMACEMGMYLTEPLRDKSIRKRNTNQTKRKGRNIVKNLLNLIPKHTHKHTHTHTHAHTHTHTHTYIYTYTYIYIYITYIYNIYKIYIYYIYMYICIYIYIYI